MVGFYANSKPLLAYISIPTPKALQLSAKYITVCFYAISLNLKRPICMPPPPPPTPINRHRLYLYANSPRYYRSATLRWPFNLIVNGGKPISFINDPFFKSFLSYDMILVSVDVRGTGASFGTHPGPWSPEEQQVSITFTVLQCYSVTVGTPI